LVPAESFGAALMYFTGSKQHNIRLRQIALDKKWLLNEYGLLEGERVIAGRTEEEIYRALGMEWIPPELREAADEIELAIQGRLPRLIDLEHLRGDLHMHTNRTDGRETLETMVRAARDRGYEYCAITDHSQALQMIGGFDTARVRKSVAEIAQVRKQVPGIHVLHGLEVDILEDGGLDLDDEGLAMLDWVIVSLHSWLRQPSEEMTKRVLRALSHPRVNAMGHPTARQIGSREPAAFQMEAVLDEAARRGVWMEINSNPRRTDLNDRHARMARDRGVQLVIDTDAHSVPELDFMRYGVFAARRAGLGPEDVMNTRPWQAFEKARKSRA
jgi:DNA polymerase (family 10)